MSTLAFEKGRIKINDRMTENCLACSRISPRSVVIYANNIQVVSLCELCWSQIMSGATRAEYRNIGIAHPSRICNIEDKLVSLDQRIENIDNFLDTHEEKIKHLGAESEKGKRVVLDIDAWLNIDKKCIQELTERLQVDLPQHVQVRRMISKNSFFNRALERIELLEGRYNELLESLKNFRRKK